METYYGGYCPLNFSFSWLDAHSVCLSLKNHPSTAFFAIFDGHGGSRASEYVAQHLVHKIEALSDVFDQEALVKICVDLDQDLLDSFDKNEANVGSTCTYNFSSYSLISQVFLALSAKKKTIIMPSLETLVIPGLCGERRRVMASRLSL